MSGELQVQATKGIDRHRGFITIATGNRKYYQMAVDLLRSYKLNGASTLPFAIICDRDCPEAREFDDMVLLDKPHHSYLDKMYLYQNSPYEETIFIDSDSLILSATDILWEDFLSTGDFSCYGKTLPLDSKKGWFLYENMGSLKPRLAYGISMHGGLYYFRKTDVCRKVFADALSFLEDYDRYGFALFKQPADEPVLALSMALAGCRPCDRQNRILFFNSHDGKMHLNAKGELLFRKEICKPVVLHFGNRNTQRYLYQCLRAQILHSYAGNKEPLRAVDRWRLRIKYLPVDTKFLARRILKGVLPRKMIDKLKR